MASISDLIESFLIQLLADGDNVSISRNELANYFSCAPSQINYVLTTRFTPARGFIVESRRGGGGCINLVRLDEDRDKFLDELRELPINEGLNVTKTTQILERMRDEDMLSEREVSLLGAVMSNKAIIAPAVAKDGMRAAMMRALATELARQKDEHKEEGKDKNA